MSMDPGIRFEAGPGVACKPSGDQSSTPLTKSHSHYHMSKVRKTNIDSLGASVMWPFTALYPERTAADIDGKTYDYIIVGGACSRNPCDNISPTDASA